MVTGQLHPYHLFIVLNGPVPLTCPQPFTHIVTLFLIRSHALLRSRTVTYWGLSQVQTRESTQYTVPTREQQGLERFARQKEESD